MKVLLPTLIVILIVQAFSDEYRNVRKDSPPLTKSPCRRCFHLFTSGNDSRLQVIPCGGGNCVALLVNRQVLGDDGNKTRIDFNFDQCGIEKRCRRRNITEREEHVSITRLSNFNTSTKETNDTIQRGEFPWMIRIEIRRNASDPAKGRCGGTLIHPQWLLTAAHCMLDNERKTFFPADNIIIYIGERARKMVNKTQWIVHSSLYIIHPKFRMTRSITSIYDFALIKLSKPVEMNNDVNVACLPDQSTSLKDGTKGFVGVWNNASSTASSVKRARKIPLRLTATETCRRYSSLSKLDEILHVCAHNDQGHNICSGDSGSGLWVRAKKPKINQWKWYVFGVASFGKSECSTGVNHDNAFAAVASQTNWIRNVMQKY